MLSANTASKMPNAKVKKKAWWNKYLEKEGDPSKLICLVEGCGKEISRGKTGTPRGGLSTHVDAQDHLEECRDGGQCQQSCQGDGGGREGKEG